MLTTFGKVLVCVTSVIISVTILWGLTQLGYLDPVLPAPLPVDNSNVLNTDSKSKSFDITPFL